MHRALVAFLIGCAFMVFASYLSAEEIPDYTTGILTTSGSCDSNQTAVSVYELPNGLQVVIVQTASQKLFTAVKHPGSLYIYFLWDHDTPREASEEMWGQELRIASPNFYRSFFFDDLGDCTRTRH